MNKPVYNLLRYTNKSSYNTHVITKEYGNNFDYIYLNASKEAIPETPQQMERVFQRHMRD